MAHSTIRPGKFWYSDKGELIQAHGGAIIVAEGKYWWYGENKTGITGMATGEPCPYRHHGLKLYSSTDLYNWKDEGYLFPESDDPTNAFHPTHIVDRPHILYNEKNKNYVMWTKTGYKNFSKCNFTVCVGKDLKSFKYLKEFSPEPHNAGDFDMFVVDGKGYIVFENPHSEMILRELDEDFTGLGEKFSSHLQLECPPYIREAPAYFERGGRRYLLTSGTTSYFANPSICYDITDLHGEWIDLGETCVDDRCGDSFHAQYASVFKHPEIEDLYIALGDRWLNDCVVGMPDIGKIFYAKFSGKQVEGVDLEKCDRRQYSDNDVSQATYVWLPIKFDEDGTPRLYWKNQWSLDDY